MQFPNFIGPTYASQSPNVDAERCINWYPEYVESNAGKNRIVLYRTPGLKKYLTLPERPIRGLWAGGDSLTPRLFAIAGAHQYELFSNPAIPPVTSVGSIGNDGLPVSMFPNGNQLMLISNGQVYVNNGAGPVAATFSSGGGNVTAIAGAFLDGFGIAAAPSSKQFYVSGLNDFTTWDPLNFASKQAYPDHLQSILTDHEELYLFGDLYSSEIWRNQGNPDFPFQRDASGFIHQALCARYTPTNLAESVYFLARDYRGGPIAVRMQGFQPVRVSNSAVEKFWQSYPTAADAEAFGYVDKGHPFWVINFPSGNATWVYDVTLNMWHERGWWNGLSLDRHRARCHTFQFGQNFVGDWQTGDIYTMDSAYYDDAGTPIHRIRTAPYLHQDDERLFHGEFVLDMQGSAGVTGILEWSDNQGKTFSNKHYAGWQPTSDQRNGLSWRRIGHSRGRVYRTTHTDGLDMALVNAYLRAEL